MKNKVKIIYQIVCLILFGVNIYCNALESHDLYLIIFGYYTHSIILYSFLILEFIYLIVNKFNKIVKIILIIIVSILLFIKVSVSIIDKPNFSKIKLNNYDQEVFVESDSYFMSGWSYLYEIENSFIMRKFDILTGDEGYQPLEDKSTYQIDYYENGFKITYNDGNVITFACYQYINNNIVKCDINDLK